MHDDKIARNAFSYTMMMATLLESTKQNGINTLLVDQIRSQNNQLIGTHIHEIIKNQTNPSIVGLTLEINNLLCTPSFLSNFKFNEISDRIEKIQNYIRKQFPYVTNDVSARRIKRQEE